MAFLIAIEGPDTAGKSTQADLLAKFFHEQGDQAVVIHFPNVFSSFGQMIQEMLKGNVTIQSPYDIAAMQLVYMSDFLSFQTTIDSYLNQDIHVILDRYTYSNYIYSSALVAHYRDHHFHSFQAAREVDRFLSLAITSLPVRQPDVLCLLTLPYEEVKRRKSTLDVIESNDQLMERVCRFYQREPLETFRSHFVKGHFKLIDATNSIENIHEIIKSEVLAKCL